MGAILTSVHVTAGLAGLALGPVAMIARKRPGVHTRAGEAYHWAVLTVCASGAVLAALDWPRLWWFLPIAAGSYGFALLGYLAAKLRPRNWPYAHVAGQGGSYIALVTALLAVNAGSLLVVLLPTILGSPVLVWVNREIRRGRRPRRSSGVLAAGTRASPVSLDCLRLGSQLDATN
jgi:hypothetical protein